MNDLRGKGKRKHQDDGNEEAEETELERILKKNEYYKRLKEDNEFKAKQLPIPETKKKKSGEKSLMNTGNIHYANRPKIAVEDISNRFPHVTKMILDNLNDKSLIGFKISGRKFFHQLEMERFYWLRIFNRYQQNLDESKDSSWKTVIEKMETEIVKKFAIAVRDFFKLKEVCKHTQTQDPEFPKWPKWPLLHIAVELGHFELCEIVISKTVDRNPIIIPDGLTPMHMAANKGNFEITQLLVEYALENNRYRKNLYGWTPLHYAASNGFLEVYKLLQSKVEVEMPETIYGTTPLHFAASEGHLELFKFIVEGLDEEFRNQWDNEGNTPLHHAASSGNVDLCKYILEKTWDRNGQNIENGDTPLHSAAKNGHLDVYKLIQKEYFIINPENNMGSTPFHEVVYTHFRDVSEGNEEHFELCKYLIKRMDDKNPRDKNGNTPLHHAADQGDFKMAELIIDHLDKDWIDPFDSESDSDEDEKEKENPPNKKGDTPLHLAVNNCMGDEQDRLKICRLILDKVDNISPVNNAGKTPLECAQYISNGGHFNTRMVEDEETWKQIIELLTTIPKNPKKARPKTAVKDTQPSIIPSKTPETTPTKSSAKTPAKELAKSPSKTLEKPATNTEKKEDLSCKYCNTYFTYTAPNKSALVSHLKTLHQAELAKESHTCRTEIIGCTDPASNPTTTQTSSQNQVGQTTQVTGKLIQTPQGGLQIILQGIQENLSEDQLQSIKKQVKDQLMKAQAEAKLQGKVPPTKITIQLPPMTPKGPTLTSPVSLERIESQDQVVTRPGLPGPSISRKN
jgi:ankyrin repeat protein